LHKTGELNMGAFSRVYSQASRKYKARLQFAHFFMGCNLACSQCIFGVGMDHRFTPCLIGELVSPDLISGLAKTKRYELKAFQTLKFIQFLAALEIYENNDTFERTKATS